MHISLICMSVYILSNNMNIEVLLAVQKTEFDHASVLSEFMHTNIIYK